MIYIGLTGWGDHDNLYSVKIKDKDKLAEYSSHFPIVELDASFYAVQPIRNMEKWIKETPASFRFVVKAYQGMTGHQQTNTPFDTKTDMFEAFKASIEPLIKAGKLAMVLFQFPPWFDYTSDHIVYLRYCVQKMIDIPIALEFRNQSWYRPKNREQTLDLIRKEGWIHTVVDEPQAGDGSVPIVPVVTHSDKTLIRFHGRNVHGWNRPRNKDTNWREVRYLYKYNQVELTEWRERILQLAKETKDVYILFNNNSGGDAASNAKTLQKMLDIDYKDLAPQQLRLF
ncbi:DUF72 domain-containing protein [Amphibacillus sp. Q70]|uniref:DUF72 domain-containing protein n=1 Tax=Amphibacillus sp. Q70 TaxID=3453416 RepID=UPI003F86A600